MHLRRTISAAATFPLRLAPLMNAIRATALFTLLAAMLAGCQTRTEAPGCTLDGPASLLPPAVTQLRLGMGKDALERLLGPADYSPTEGQYYFSTGGDCPVDDSGRLASCGVIADFKDYRGPEAVLMPRLQSCRWGAIAE